MGSKAIEDFIIVRFESAGFSKCSIGSAWPMTRWMFRHPSRGHSPFVLLTTVDDFRDPMLEVSLAVGVGQPEMAEDPAELSYASITTAELGIVSPEAESMPRGIEIDKARGSLEASLDYCERFLNGDTGVAIARRNVRNAEAALDPLHLHSLNTEAFDALQERNEQLKGIIAKYV